MSVLYTEKNKHPDVDLQILLTMIGRSLKEAEPCDALRTSKPGINMTGMSE